MSAVPPLSRAVLDALYPHGAGPNRSVEEMTPVTRTFVRVQAMLDAHAAALTALDRIEEIVVAAHGYPRVPLPQTVNAPDYASDVATIVRHLGNGPSARRLTAELRRRQATFARAAVYAGLEAARAREARAASELSAIAAHLLLAPVQTHEDLAIKLAVLIAAGEATDDDPLAFPWLYVRALLADMHLTSPGS